MKYLITGGCGFIGVNFADRLLSRGDKVVLLDNLSRRGTTENQNYLTRKYKSCDFVHADIRVDFKKMKKLANEVDAVYHLAGQVAVTKSVSDPRTDFDENALGAFNMLEAVRLSRKKPIFIYASTNKVYGGMDGVGVVRAVVTNVADHHFVDAVHAHLGQQVFHRVAALRSVVRAV